MQLPVVGKQNEENVTAYHYQVFVLCKGKEGFGVWMIMYAMFCTM